MSHLRSQKKLLSEDLNHLILSATGCDENSEEYANYEKNAWNIIFNYNCPSVNKTSIRSKINGFIEKFRIHAYSLPQKAKNLELLVDHYLSLNCHEEDVKWNLLHLMLLMSKRPTDDKDDATPLSFPLYQSQSEEEIFDWGAYLKEGLPDYRLPSDDSLSEDEEEDASLRNTKEAIYQASREILRQRQSEHTGSSTSGFQTARDATGHSHTIGISNVVCTEGNQANCDFLSRGNVASGIEGLSNYGNYQFSKLDLSSVTRLNTMDTRTTEDSNIETVREVTSKDELKSALIAKEAYNRSHPQWWTDMFYRQEPPSKMPIPNGCSMWENSKATDGVVLKKTRILSEVKAMKELIWALVHPQDYFIIKKTDEGYKPREMVSISSVNPNDFHSAVLEICPYLSIIEKLNCFVNTMNDLPADSSCNIAPNTYVAYAGALKHVMDKFKDYLSIIEAYINKQEEIYMLSYILLEIKPWLRHLKCLYSVHSQAIFDDWRNHNNWINASRLLVVLHNSLDHFYGWEKLDLTIIFLKSLRPYVEVLETWLVNSMYADYQDEFIIKRPSKHNCEGNLIVQDYKTELSKLNIHNTILLDYFVYFALRACSSVDFQLILKKNSFDKNTSDLLDTLNGDSKSPINALYLQLCNMFSLINDGCDEGKTEETYILPHRKYFKDKLESLRSSQSTNTSVDNRPNTKDEFPIVNGWDGTSFVSRDNVLMKAFDSVLSPINKNLKSSEITRLFSKMDCINPENPEISRVVMLLKKHITLMVKSRLQPKGFAKDALMNDHRLLEHFAILRCVYLFSGEALMSAFSKLLFSKVLTNSLNATSWTNELWELLYNHYPIISSNFTVTLPPTKLVFKKAFSQSDSTFPDFLEFSQQVNISYLAEPPLNLILTPESLDIYNHLFHLLLKTKWSLHCLHSLSFQDLTTDRSNSIFSQLISLRMFLLHNVQTLWNYFISIASHNFDSEITELCSVARDVNVIANALNDKILRKKMKLCFLTDSFDILDNILMIFKLCQMLPPLWKLSTNTRYVKNLSEELSNLEHRYQDCLDCLAEGLYLLGDDYIFKNNDNFRFLCDEIFNNKPGNWV